MNTNAETKVDSLSTEQLENGEWRTTDSDYCGCSSCLAQEGANIIGWGDTKQESIDDYYLDMAGR